VGVVRKGYSVIKRIGLLIVAALMASMMMVATAAPAFADPLPSNCDKERGTVICTQEGKNPKFEREVRKKGSLQSSHDPVIVCGPPCPPGQFK